MSLIACDSWNCVFFRYFLFSRTKIEHRWKRFPAPIWRKNFFPQKTVLPRTAHVFLTTFGSLLAAETKKKNSLGYDEHQKRKKKAEFSVICVAEIFFQKKSTKNAPLACDFCKFLCQFLHIFCSISRCVFSFFGISKKKLKFQFSAVIQGGRHMSTSLVPSRNQKREKLVSSYPVIPCFFGWCGRGNGSYTGRPFRG